MLREAPAPRVDRAPLEALLERIRRSIRSPGVMKPDTRWRRVEVVQVLGAPLATGAIRPAKGQPEGHRRSERSGGAEHCADDADPLDATGACASVSTAPATSSALTVTLSSGGPS